MCVVLKRGDGQQSMGPERSRNIHSAPCGLTLGAISQILSCIICTHTHIYIYTNIYIHIYIYIYNIYVYVQYIYIYMYVYACIYIYICVYAYVHVYVDVYVSNCMIIWRFHQMEDPQVTIVAY